MGVRKQSLQFFRRYLTYLIFSQFLPTFMNLFPDIYNQRKFVYLFIYLFGVLRRFQHCTGHITTGSWNGRGNQYIEFARVVYCKLPTNGKQLPAFPLKAITGIEPRPQRWEARVLPLCHRGPQRKFDPNFKFSSLGTKVGSMEPPYNITQDIIAAR